MRAQDIGGTNEEVGHDVSTATSALRNCLHDEIAIWLPLFFNDPPTTEKRGVAHNRVEAHLLLLKHLRELEYPVKRSWRIRSIRRAASHERIPTSRLNMC